MIDINDEYEKFLDNETAELMSIISYEQIAEAISCRTPADSDLDEAILAKAVRDGDDFNNNNNIKIGLMVRTICYYYWRSIIQEKHFFEDWKSERSQDRDAERAQMAADSYRE